MLVIPDIHSGEYTVLFNGENILLTNCCKIKLIPKVANKVSKGLPYRFFTTSLSINIPTSPVSKNATGIDIKIEIDNY